MTSNLISQTASDIQILYKASMELYEAYFKALEEAVEANTDLERAHQLDQLAQEAEAALEHDLGIFEKAVSLDEEGLNNMQDELKIATLHKQLQNG